MSDIFDGVDSADSTSKIPFITAGLYLLKVKKFGTGVSKNPKTLGKKFVKLVAEVVESNSEKHPVGSSVSHMIMEDAFGYYKGDIQNLGLALLGQTETAMKASEATKKQFGENLKKLSSAAQPAVGELVRAEAFDQHSTKNEGKSFTKVIYSPYTTTEVNTVASTVTAKTAQARK
jgi:hypothetical protein